MLLAKIAAYILAVVVILGLSIKFLWLFFILFMYRTFASFIPFQWVTSHIGLHNHLIYFIILLTLSIVAEQLLFIFTRELVWIRYVVLACLVVWVLKNYTLSDIFLFKDYLQANGLWGINSLTAQIKQLFSTGPQGFQHLFTSIFQEMYSVFVKLINSGTNALK